MRSREVVVLATLMAAACGGAPTRTATSTPQPEPVQPEPKPTEPAPDHGQRRDDPRSGARQSDLRSTLVEHNVLNAPPRPRPRHTMRHAESIAPGKHT